MERIRKLTHLGKEVLVVDFSGLDADAYWPVAKQAMAVIAQAAPASLLTITVLKGARFSVGTSDDIKRYSQHNRPFVKASAVVGLSALQRVIFNTVRPFLTQDIATFDTLPEALAWLVQRP
jgi:hypothetical protein